MSMSEDGRYLLCDGDRCDARALFPVRRWSHGQSEEGDAVARADGWLWAKSGESWRHFCPRCKHAYLETLRAQPGGAEDGEGPTEVETARRDLPVLRDGSGESRRG